MKKLIACIVAATLATLVLFGCSGNNTTQNTASAQDGEGKLSIVATTFPSYDWMRHILGDRIDDVDLTLLLDNGVDLHSFQPTTADIAKISTCDMFVYVGGVSDAWVSDALANSSNENMIAVNLMDVLGDSAKLEEVKEGMQDAHNHEADDHDHENEVDHDHEDDGNHDHEDESELDEHVWLSLKNADLLCSYLADRLVEIDPDHAAEYQDNATAYCGQLKEADTQYQEVVDNAQFNTLLFGDRFPFRYLVDDYGIDYYAAFSGCSAETEASFATVVFLADKMDELGLQHVIVIETSDQSIARTIIQNTEKADQDVLVLDSMQAVTSSDIDAGETYLSIMQKNLDTLRTALG